MSASQEERSAIDKCCSRREVSFVIGPNSGYNHASSGVTVYQIIARITVIVFGYLGIWAQGYLWP